MYILKSLHDTQLIIKNHSMTGYDFQRPYVDASTLPLYIAIDPEVSSRYGRTVRASQMSNSECNTRYVRMSKSNNMKAPPSHGRIFGGFLVIRKLGTSEQYETWIPDITFDKIYKPQEVS